MNLRLHLQPTKRSDVMCLACIGFGADHVILRTDGTETDTGAHKRCMPEVGVKFTRRRMSVKDLERNARTSNDSM